MPDVQPCALVERGIALRVRVDRIALRMKTSLRRFAILFAAAAALSACNKKEVQVAHEAEKALPAAEQVTPAATTEERVAASVASDKAALDAPIPGERPVADVPALPPPADGAAGGEEYEAWFKKYSLDLNDPTMLDADPDGDGASNRDEFLANSNPRDPNARPGVHQKIRLKEFTEVRLPIVVEAVEGDKARIRRTDGEGKVETVKAGDTLAGLPLKVQRVTQVRDVDKGGNPVDRSVVMVEDSASRERLTLVKDMPARTSASYAVLTAADGSGTVKVRQGDTFKWPGDDTASYTVVDLREDQVVLQQVETRKMWTVTRSTTP